MKTPNSLEELMQSWTPRQPSSEIHEKLFGAGRRAASVATGSRRHGIHLPWYQTLGASLAACVVLVLTIVNLTQVGANSSRSLGETLALSNNSFASLALASAPHNNLSAQILGWTNEGSSGSSNRSFDLLTTNRILR